MYCAWKPSCLEARVTTDLVCKTSVNKEATRFFSEYNAGTYYFCSAECKRKFDDHPDDYIREHAKKDLRI